jgi:hypothetical protein
MMEPVRTDWERHRKGSPGWWSAVAARAAIKSELAQELVASQRYEAFLSRCWVIPNAGPLSSVGLPRLGAVRCVNVCPEGEARLSLCLGPRHRVTGRNARQIGES